MRIGLILGYDDLELANPLGAVRGKHNTACFYVALANLNASERFEHKNICVLMLVLSKVFKRCGPIRVLSGGDAATGEVRSDDPFSFGAQFRSSVAGESYIEVRLA